MVLGLRFLKFAVTRNQGSSGLSHFVIGGCKLTTFPLSAMATGPSDSCGAAECECALTFEEQVDAAAESVAECYPWTDEVLR